MKKTTMVIVLLLICILKMNAQPPKGLSASATTSPISIYQSPASDMIYVASNNGNGQLVLDLYDTKGNKVFSKAFRSNTEKIAASQLATGTYTVLVSSNGKMVRSQRIQID